MIRILQKDNRATKAIFAVVIGAAIVTMVITLVPGIFDNGATGDGTVFATVRTPGIFGRFTGESTSIKTADVQRVAAQQLRQQGLPEQYLQLLMPRAGQLEVERAVLEREADRLGLAVSDADLSHFLQSGPYAQYLFPGGTFVGEDKYIDFVESQFRLPVKEFETELKADLELQRLQALVTGGVSVSDAAVRAQYLQTGTKVKFDYAVISSSSIQQGINPSDADLQTFFKQNAPRYATAVPEQRKLALISFDNTSIPGGQSAVTPADIQAYYAAHAAQYQTPEQVKTRHILIMVPKGADAKTDAAAKAKTAGILAELKAGGNFADLAKKDSEDPGSKNTGGELPMIPTSGLDPAYAKAAMALSPGQTSDLVRSQFGYHIIQTEEKQAAGTKPLSEVAASIGASLQSQKSAAAAQNYATQLATEAQKTSLQKTADAHNLHLVTTDFLPQSGTISSLPDSTSVMTAAFGAAKGAAPQVASTSEGYAIFQVTDVQPAHAPEFAGYKAKILDDYRAQKAPEVLNQKLTALSDRAHVLNDLHKAAAEFNVPVLTSDLVGRDGQVAGVGSLTGAASVVFTMAKGAISGPIDEGANGAVLQLTDKQEPSAADIASNLPAAKDKLLEQQRQEAFSVFVGSLMDRYTKANSITYTKKQQSDLPFSK